MHKRVFPGFTVQERIRVGQGRPRPYKGPADRANTTFAFLCRGAAYSAIVAVAAKTGPAPDPGQSDRT